MLEWVIHCSRWSSYSEIPIIRPPMVLFKIGLNSEQVSLIKAPFTLKIHYKLPLKQVVWIMRVVLISSCFNLAEFYCSWCPRHYELKYFSSSGINKGLNYDKLSLRCNSFTVMVYEQLNYGNKFTGNGDQCIIKF